MFLIQNMKIYYIQKLCHGHIIILVFEDIFEVKRWFELENGCKAYSPKIQSKNEHNYQSHYCDASLDEDKYYPRKQ